MSFFDDASLAFLPSGGAGKDGKAYSIKPTDGSGDFTFSRGSNLAASRIGPTGLIEKGRENLLLQSNQFDTTWSAGNFTFLDNQSDKDGGANAWKATCSTTYNYLSQNFSGSGVYTFSGYFRKGDSDEGVRFNFSASADTNVYVDLTDGSSTDNGNLIYKSITAAGNGFYKVVVSANLTSPTSLRFFVTNGVTTQVAGNIYIQEFQLELGLAATDYIETGATTGKAGLLEDEPRFDYSGGATCPSLLLEPSRTQLITQSEFFGSGSGWNSISASPATITDNFGTSPEGLQNAAKLQFNGSNSWLGKTFTAVAGNDYSASVYLKVEDGGSDFNVTLTYYPTGGGTRLDKSITITSEWQRFDALFENVTVGTGATNFVIRSNESRSCLVWGAQAEEGSYPTSYIPNHSGGSVTRGDDRPYLTLDLSSIAPKSAGTMYLEYDADVVDNGAYWVGLSTSSSLNTDWVFIGRDGASNRLYIRANGSAIDSTSILHSTSGTQKLAIVWNESTGTAAFINGTKVDSTTGSFSFAGNFGHLNLGGSTASNPVSVVAPTRQFLIFPEALSDADCITLTTL